MERYSGIRREAVGFGFLNVRIYSPVLREDGGSWMVEPARDRLKWRDIEGTLRDYQDEEPESKWRLETRGTDGGWHAWKGRIGGGIRFVGGFRKGDMVR